MLRKCCILNIPNKYLQGISNEVFVQSTFVGITGNEKLTDRYLQAASETAKYLFGMI